MTDADFIPLGDTASPQVLAEEKDFLVVYKPPRMHSTPLPGSAQADTLAGWCAARFPETADLGGRRAGEGGLLHRLDYETQGLLLVARTQTGMESLLEQQRAGKIAKEYTALAQAATARLPGFSLQRPEGMRIQSAFRPYGPGRKAVRPVPEGEQYLTEILHARPAAGGLTLFRIRIVRGFRHQIRCHLAWLGMPIVNDSLYGAGPFGSGLLGLRACSLLFADPASGTERGFLIPPIECWGI